MKEEEFIEGKDNTLWVEEKILKEKIDNPDWLTPKTALKIKPYVSREEPINAINTSQHDHRSQKKGKTTLEKYF